MVRIASTLALLLVLVLDAAAPSPARADDETIVVIDPLPALLPGRAESTVTREEMDERQPRSAPDALRWEPGVYVQQTAAAQGSAYLRGRTGLQTLLLFDGVRLNNSLWRQGPNQYFFLIDTRVLSAIEVVRGGASTRFGSDAIGGVLHAIPRDPVFDERRARPRVELRGGSADREIGGRAEVSTRVTDDIAVLAGLGYRDVGLLEGGGAVRGTDGEPAIIPGLDRDGRTQLGTGFREAAWDARAVWRRGGTRLTLGYYDYRQLDAPRTDQCPPPFAPPSECLVFDEQFHTMGYLSLAGERGRWARDARVVVSAQEQHERKTRHRPLSQVENGGRYDVRTVGNAASARADATPALSVRYGADTYLDLVDSVAWLRFTDIDFVRYDSRGQYMAGSRYATGGGFAEASWTRDWVTVRGGGRIGGAWADAPGDTPSATTAVDRGWLATAAVLGVEWRADERVTLLATLDRSFRAPNLDDLTGRQAAGPGFQIENAGLAAERALSAEVGLRVRDARGELSGWAYVSRLDDAIVRAQRAIEDCPPTSDECQGAWFRYQLVNVDGARVVGAEAAGELALGRATVRATLGWAHGDGPNPQERPSDPELPYVERVPLSRIPPLNGTAELRVPWSWGFVTAGVRWAGRQDRLAPSDLSDERIPEGGTPGYVVVDVRAGVRVGTRARVGVVAENLGDAAYRYHGSSINGPGRSAMVWLEVTP
jgi:iron complex outermembrane receptor protein/hemoglobin/transferrin/lactoferrin receptor protein